MLHLSAPGVVLARSTYEDAGPRGVASLAQFVGELEGLVAPLCVHVDLDHFDEFGLPIGEALGRRVLRAPAPKGVVVAHADGAAVESTGQIRCREISSWLSGVLSDAGDGVGWSVMRTVAAKAYVDGAVPEVLLNLEGQPFSPASGSDERGAYVAGPSRGSSVDPPIVVDAVHEGFRLEVHLRVAWPLWTELGSGGYRAVVKRVQRLLESGWSLADATGPFGSRV